MINREPLELGTSLVYLIEVEPLGLLMLKLLFVKSEKFVLYLSREGGYYFNNAFLLSIEDETSFF